VTPGVIPGTREALAQVLLGDSLVGVGRGQPENRAETFVQLRRDEIEPFLDAIALGLAGGRHQPGGGILVRDPLHDHRPFGQTFAVVELEHRHLALAVDGPIVGSRLGFLFLIVACSRSKLAPTSRITIWGESEQAPGAK